MFEEKTLACLLVSLCLLCGCGAKEEIPPVTSDGSAEQSTEQNAFGEYIPDGELYANVPEQSDLTVTYVSGTKDCYTLTDGTLTFGAVDADTVYAVSGTFVGRIVIDVGDAHKCELELCGFSLACGDGVPITAVSGDEVSVKAKKGTENFVYDLREAAGEDGVSGAVHSDVDLELCGKGTLNVVSENNNGVHSKDDLQVKNLTLFVHCKDNALKGNDSVEMTDCNTTLIATEGDGIKTSASDISGKGNQRGTVSITGGTHTVYAARDGIDAAYDAVIDGETTVLEIYTDRYSAYSQDADASDEGMSEDTVSAERSDGAQDGQGGNMRPVRNDGFGGRPQPPQDGFGGGFGGGAGGGGFGGMQEGNPDKSAYSAKGIKAANGISIANGSVTVKSYDDAVHASGGNALENGETSSGNVSVMGGTLSLYSGDDGIHADGALCISGGDVSVDGCYEGLEGDTVSIGGGMVSVTASDDGINSTAASGEGVRIADGTLYIYAGGDGIDANSRESYKGIVFAGGNTAVISTSGGNSAIDTERGYAYQGGRVLALMPAGGMSSEALHCENFSSVAVKQNVSASGVLCVQSGGVTVLELELQSSMSGMAVYPGDSSAVIQTKKSTDAVLDGNGVWWG